MWYSCGHLSAKKKKKPCFDKDAHYVLAIEANTFKEIWEQGKYLAFQQQSRWCSRKELKFAGIRTEGTKVCLNRGFLFIHGFVNGFHIERPTLANRTCTLKR